MSLFAFNPEDFPDVPTRKALIAIDLQNDFLAEDGALPVKQPDGMVDRITKLADAVRNSGYGEIIWVRSQFDTCRPAGDQHIMAADTPQLPARPGQSTASAAARREKASAANPPLEADPEAFLSIVEDQTSQTKPECVRKGTKGAELFPAFARAKGPGDYAMTKSYYSAFQSGQLLNLLRRQFATELYICGSLSNVSVYATALAASSHGFDITIVEDCCGYRSEMRHMNAARSLVDQTGCHFANAADVIPTLRPRSPPRATDRKRSPPSGPSSISPKMMAAAIAESKAKQAGIPVRPKPAPPPLHPVPNKKEEAAKRGKRIADGLPSAALSSSPSPLPSPAPDLATALRRLKLNTPPAEPSNVSETSGQEVSATASTMQSKNDSPQPENEQEVQPMVRSLVDGRGAKSNRANARGEESAAQKPNIQRTGGVGSKALPEGDNKASPALVGSPRSGATPKRQRKSRAAQVVETATGVPGPMDSIVSAELLMAPTPEHISKKLRDNTNRVDGPKSPIPPPTQSTDRTSDESKQQQSSEEAPDAESDTEAGMMPPKAATKPVVSKPLCEGDTNLTENFLPQSLIDGLFERLCEEVHFKKMMHQGGEVPRFVAVQGHIDADGTHPVYRHPSDESPPLQPFTPTVQTIRELVEKALGHPLNHVLIQCYRDGNDHISEHSDKTLDIFRWSYIANVSIGAQRTMVFRTKRGEKKDTSATKPGPQTPESNAISVRQTIRCPMPHNSLIKMGLVTNEKWLHGIKPDKRPQVEKAPAELAWRGTRISLTFRYIGTFLTPGPTTPSEPVIWGQGATSKTRDTARPVVNGQTTQAVAMLRAFGRENNCPDFVWEANYGTGFDVLHMKAAPRFFGCGDAIIDGRVRLMLSEVGVKYARGNIGGGIRYSDMDDGGMGVPVRFEVDDADRTTVVGDVAILLYLDARHPKKRSGDAEMARIFTRLQAAIALGTRWRRAWNRVEHDALEQRQSMVREFKAQLVPFDGWAEKKNGDGVPTIASGADGSVADYALWPVLHEIAVSWRGIAEGQGAGMTVFGYLGLDGLDTYYGSFATKQSVLRVFGEGVLDAVCVEASLSATSRDGSSSEQDLRSLDEGEDMDQLEEKEGVITQPPAPGKGKLPLLSEFGQS